MAAECLDLSLPSGSVSLPAGPADITVAPLTADQARVELPTIFERFSDATPGSFRRWPDWWEQRHFRDTPDRRPPGSTERRHIVARRNGDAVGYTVYRQIPKWSDAGPQGVVSVVELIADDDDARRALWHFLTTVDLFPNVQFWNVPVDDPVLIEADRFRLIKSSRGDTLWVRLLDIPVALQGRRYERDGALTLRIADRFLGRGGTFELVVRDGSASCLEASTPPDVALDISDLGALYLGGRSAVTMARAGQVAGTDAAISQLDELFRTATAPYISEVF